MNVGDVVAVVDGAWTGESGEVVEMRGPLIRIQLGGHQIVVHVSKVQAE